MPALDGFDTSQIRVGGQALSVAMADTPERRQQGLRSVESLPRGLEGMLFVFGESRPATFGMLDTLLPLDIWWFDADGRLVGATEMQPCPEEPCTAFASPGPVSWALETPLGAFDFEPGAQLSTVENP